MSKEGGGEAYDPASRIDAVCRPVALGEQDALVVDVRARDGKHEQAHARKARVRVVRLRVIPSANRTEDVAISQCDSQRDVDVKKGERTSRTSVGGAEGRCR